MLAQRTLAGGVMTGLLCTLLLWSRDWTSTSPSDHNKDGGWKEAGFAVTPDSALVGSRSNVRGGEWAPVGSRGNVLGWQRLLPVVNRTAAQQLQRELHLYVSNVDGMARQLELTEPLPAPSYERPTEARPLLPEYIIILGVEGVGHHGVVEWLNALALLSGRVPLRNPLFYTERAMNNGQKLGGLTRDLAEVCRAIDRPIVPVIWFSFPSRTWGRNLTHCEADFKVCFDKIAAVTGVYRVADNYRALLSTQASTKFLLLDRAFFASAWSHKDWDSGLEPHARLIALYKQYLSAQAGAIPPPKHHWAHVRYESLCQTGLAQLQVARRIADFLNWQVSDKVLMRSLENAFRPSSKNALAEMSPTEVRSITKLYAKHSPHWAAFRDAATGLDNRDWVAHDGAALQAAVAHNVVMHETKKP